MKWICISLVSVLVFGGVTIATAGEAGRYEAIRMEGNAVFVLDTAEGHMWVMNVYDVRMNTIYFGKVRPGAKMGEVLDEYDGEKIHKD
jgi:hypothetical protein